MTELITHLVTATDVPPGDPARSTIGGHPILPKGIYWPHCCCGERLILFFQLDIREEFGLPFATGSHLSVFMCPVHNDAWKSPTTQRLPQRFWESRITYDGLDGFYHMMLFPPGQVEQIHSCEPHLECRRLEFQKTVEVIDSDFYDDDYEGMRDPVPVPGANTRWPGVCKVVDSWHRGIDGFKVGGQPCWSNRAEVHTCCCGSPMDFICQVPSDYKFPARVGAPEQPGGCWLDGYVLFLGNNNYIFACRKQCSPYAVYAAIIR
jgi:hypothetical protein